MANKPLNPTRPAPTTKATTVTTTKAASETTEMTGAIKTTATTVTTSGVKVPANFAEAWDHWLPLPRAGGNGSNAERSQSDLLNHRRSLELYALAVKDTTDLTEMPFKELALEAELVRERLYEGAKLQAERSKRAMSSSKTLSNLASNLMRIRSDLKDLLSLPELAPQTGKQLRMALPKEKRRERLSHDAWPESFVKDYNAFKAYANQPFYAGPGKEHRGKAVRTITINARKVRCGQYVRYCLEEEKITDLTLEHLVDIERIHRFRAWYFKDMDRGGYDAFAQTCITAGLFAKFLCATGRAFSEFTPDSKAATAPWTILYKLGRDTKAEGAGEGKLATRTRIHDMTPKDLLALAERAWTTPPRKSHYGGFYALSVFNRKRSAFFFGLAPFMPVRRRNWIDMTWDKNLYRKRNGNWAVRYKGDELKVGQRKGEVNVYEHELPSMASMWINRWRSYLQETIGPDFEKRVPYVLPAWMRERKPDGSVAWGRCNDDILPRGIGNASLELRGHDFPMHQIRHIMATSLVNGSTSLEDAQVAADLLGDKLETVLATYYRPNRDALRRSYFERLQNEVGFKDD